MRKSTWRKTLKSAGLTGIRLHDLRHFYASGLIAAGCDVVTVQRAVGHSKATTTLDTYSHLWPTAEDRTRKAAEAMLRTLDMVRKFMQLEKAADTLIPAGPGSIAAGQRLAGSQVEL